jgi:hypothetical protein
VSHVYFLPWIGIKIPVVEDADLAPCFIPEKEGEEPARRLVPLIFSHGMLNCGNMYSHTHRELASYGLMVVAMDHMDGSCNITENMITGETVLFDKSVDVDCLDDKKTALREK